MSHPDRMPDRMLDRMLQSGLEEVLGGVTPPDLVAKVQRQLEGVPREAGNSVDSENLLGGIVPPARRGFLRLSWPWWSVAAAAGALLWALGTMGSAGNVPRVDLEIWVLRGELTWFGDGETVRGEAGERLSVPLGEGDRLHSGMTVPTALQLPQFGTLYTETNTILEIQSMDIRQRRGVITIGAVTLVVLTGAVTWNALSRTEQADTGETLRLESAAPEGSGITAREQELLDQNEELKRLLAASESQAARNRLEVEEAVDAAAEVVAVETPEPIKVELRFTDAKYAEALAGVDWEVMGIAMKGQIAVSAELIAAVLAGEMPLELAGELQQFNGQLIGQLQPLMEGGVPGSGLNGTFTHPLVAANSVDHVLATADVALSEDQSSRLQAITDHYVARDENLRISAEGHDFFLETILAETAMKRAFYQEMEQLLTPEQRNVIYPDGVHDTPLDLFNTGLVWNQVAKPARVDGPEDLARRNFSRFSEGLQLREDQQERLRPLLDNWSRSYPAGYWSDKPNALELKGMLKTSRTRIAAERQLDLFRAMLNGLGLTAEQRQKLLANNGVLVPLPK